MNPSLTSEEFDLLREIRAATDTKRELPSVQTNRAGKLRAFGFIQFNALGRFTITNQGREALLEQDMRDAEDR